MQWVFLIAWIVPLIELVMLVTGQIWYRTRFESAPWKFSRLIIQITTTGREEKRVNQIIAEIRSYRLSMSYQIWVVNEPGLNDAYPRADRVLTVPGDFTARSRYKARALEYSRRERRSLGLNGPDTKILFVDDDTSVTESYIERAFAADYDICQGVTAPRVQYGALPLQHFWLSHFDDLRTRGCLIYCAFFQGFVGKPLHVHGEGLCVTGATEDKVTWNYPVIASEDLTFGQNAAYMGCRWGFFNEYVLLTSPWSWRDFKKQRKRWLWGNIHAIRTRQILPLIPAIMIAAKYLSGFSLTTISGIALILRALHLYTPPSGVSSVFWLSLATWLAIYAVSGWINSADCVPARGRRALRQGGVTLRRCWQTLMAVSLCPLTSLSVIVVHLIALAEGDPKSFEVIRKTAQVAVPAPAMVLPREAIPEEAK
jgi:Glycosyl transferase family group 2